MRTSAQWYQQAIPLNYEQLRELGNVLVVAPHQDDESLGCGGTIALLKQAGLQVNVLFTSDGSMSHPNSKLYPEERLISLREQEAITALEILGLAMEHIIFLRLKDSMVPNVNDDTFYAAVDSISNILTDLRPDTVILPWRRDPHQDHRATWQIINEALLKITNPVRVLEYFVWLWERAVEGELPEPCEGTVWKIKIDSVLEKKSAAIIAHVSQTTDLINDDPQGFTLSDHMLSHFENPFEYFFESK